MTEVRHFCDACGARITQDRTGLKLACGAERIRRGTVDMCSDCASIFWAWLDQRPDGSTAPVPRASLANRLAPARP